MFDSVLIVPLDYLSYFAVVLRGIQRERLMYAKPIIVFTPNLEFSPYSEVMHESTTFKLTKGQQKLMKSDQIFTLTFFIILLFSTFI